MFHINNNALSNFIPIYGNPFQQHTMGRWDSLQYEVLDGAGVVVVGAGGWVLGRSRRPSLGEVGTRSMQRNVIQQHTSSSQAEMSGSPLD